MLNEKTIDKRVLFLRLFTKQLILNSAPHEVKEAKRIEEVIKAHKQEIKQKEDTTTKKIMFAQASRFNPQNSLYAQEFKPVFSPDLEIAEETNNKEIQPISSIEVFSQPKKYEPKRGLQITEDYLQSKEIHPSFLVPKGRNYKSDSETKRSKENLKNSFTSDIPATKPLKTSVKTTITPRPELRVQQKPTYKKFSVAVTRYPEQGYSRFQHIDTEAPNIDLGKLNPILLDQAVTLMECPGPGKFILLKKNGEINLSKITLNQEEIDKIIKTFSERARIPIIGGIFRAEAEDLTINAVISGLIGSRFIIYRKTPYTILEGET